MLHHKGFELKTEVGIVRVGACLKCKVSEVLWNGRVEHVVWVESQVLAESCGEPVGKTGLAEDVATFGETVRFVAS